MARRNPAEGIEHERLVRMMAEHFDNLGYLKVKADLDGYERPDVIYGTIRNHLPDVSCERNDPKGTRIIVEAETSSTLADEHTASQWSLFRSEADRVGGEFHLVVPSASNRRRPAQEAQQRLAELGIHADEIWEATK